MPQIMQLDGNVTNTVRLDGTVNNYVTSFQATPVSGTITSPTSTVAASTAGGNSATISINGTYTGVNLTFELSDDNGTTWYTISAARIDGSTIENTTGVLSPNTSRAWNIAFGTGTNIRIRATAWSSGTANIKILVYTGSGISSTVSAPSNGGGLTISGTVTANQGTAQTAANGWPIRVSDGSNLINVGDNSNSAVRVSIVSGGGSGGTSSSFGSAFPATGTASGFSDGTDMQGARVFDLDTGAGSEYNLGLNLRKSASGGSVEFGTSSDPIRTDPTGTTTQPISGTVTANAGSGTFTVAGTVTANAGTGNFGVNVTQIAGSAVSTAATGIIKVGISDSSGSSITLGQQTMATSVPVVVASNQSAISVSGTVTSNIGTTGGLALDATLTGGTQRTRITDGTNNVTTLFDADSGAGTQYIEGVNLRKSASGGSVEFGTSSDPIRIDPTGTTTQPVSGTVTANAGSGTFTVSGTVTANIGTSGSLALDASVQNLSLAQASTTSGQRGILIQGAVTTAAPTYTTAQTSPLSLTTAGALRVDNSANIQPVSGTVTANAGTGNFGVNITQIAGSAVSTAATGIIKVGISDSSGSSITLGQQTMANSVPVTVASDQTTINVNTEVGSKTTYSAAITGLAAPNNPTDIFTITGSATKTIKVTRIRISGTSNSGGAGIYSVLLIKRSTANTGGTSTTPTVVPWDSTNAAGTAVVRAYTANPTLGTTVGTIMSSKATFVTQSTATLYYLPYVLDLGLNNMQACTLRGTSEVLAVNLNATTVQGNSLDIDIVWTET